MSPMAAKAEEQLNKDRRRVLIISYFSPHISSLQHLGDGFPDQMYHLIPTVNKLAVHGLPPPCALSYEHVLGPVYSTAKGEMLDVLYTQTNPLTAAERRVRSARRWPV